jgi:hypothetical protein
MLKVALSRARQRHLQAGKYDDSSMHTFAGKRTVVSSAVYIYQDAVSMPAAILLLDVRRATL